MNGIILFVTPAVAALGALATLSPVRPGAERCENESVPRAGSGPALALDFAVASGCAQRPA